MSFVLAVLAGKDLPNDVLRSCCAEAQRIVAADGAVEWLAEIGVVPDVVVGDFDSSIPETRARVPRVLHDPGQDDTDLDKMLRLLESESAEAVVVAGLEGDRIDHVLASLDSLARSRLQIELVLRLGRGRIVRGPGSCSVVLEPGDLVSVLALTDLGGLSLEGVKWPLSDVDAVRPRTPSISNQARGGPTTVKLRDGVALFVASR